MSRHIIYICILFSALRVTAQQPELVLPLGHSKRVSCASFSPDGKLVVTGGFDKVLNVWETFTGKKVRGLEAAEQEIQFAFFSKNQHYLIAGNDSVSLIWNIPGYQLLGVLKNTRKISISSNEKFLLIANRNGKVIEYNLPDLKIKYQYTADVPPDEDIYGYWHYTDISPDSKYLLINHDNAVRVYDAETGKETGSTKIADVKNCFFLPGGNGFLVVTGSGISKTILPGFTTTKVLKAETEFSIESRDHNFLLVNAIYNTEHQRSFLWDVRKSKIVFSSDTIRAVSDTFFVVKDSIEGTGEYHTGTATSYFPTYVDQYRSWHLHQ